MGKSLRGHFLIASKNLLDPNFFQSVVLLIEHNDEGAMGLVINRPSEITISRALAGHFDYPDDDQLIFKRRTGRAEFAVHSAQRPRPRPDGEAADERRARRHQRGSVRRSGPPCDRGRRFAQVSNCLRLCRWSRGQLEGELARNDWRTIPAGPNFVFDTEPYEVWKLAVQETSPAKSTRSGTSGDPKWN